MTYAIECRVGFALFHEPRTRRSCRGSRGRRAGGGLGCLARAARQPHTGGDRNAVGAARRHVDAASPAPRASLALGGQCRAAPARPHRRRRGRRSPTLHTVLAIEGEGREQVRPGDLLSRLLERTPDDRLHVVPRLVSSDPSCPLRSAVLAPLTVQGRRAGTLIAFYRSDRTAARRRAARRAGGRKPGLGAARAVGHPRAGGASGAGRAARAAGADLAAFHLQRAGRRGRATSMRGPRRRASC